MGNKWKDALMLESLLLSDIFPAQAQDQSLWADWKNRIEDGQETELDRVTQRQKEFENSIKARSEESLPDEIVDSFIDEAFQAVSLTNTMHAALVVALWSKMELFLKCMIDACKEHTRVKGHIPYPFEDIKEFFLEQLSINFETLNEYATIDAIRILNNSFKHSDGFYKPEKGKDHTRINQGVFNQWHEVFDDKWKVIGGGYIVNYTKLPICELAAASNAFCQHLIKSITKALENRMGGNVNGE